MTKNPRTGIIIIPMLHHQRATSAVMGENSLATSQPKVPLNFYLFKPPVMKFSSAATAEEKQLPECLSPLGTAGFLLKM